MVLLNLPTRPTCSFRIRHASTERLKLSSFLTRSTSASSQQTRGSVSCMVSCIVKPATVDDFEAVALLRAEAFFEVSSPCTLHEHDDTDMMTRIG